MFFKFISTKQCSRETRIEELKIFKDANLYFVGLSSIRVDGFDPASSNYNLTIPAFDVATTSVVPVDFFADCCVRRAAVTVFDVAGNVNSTSFNQGPLKG